MSLTEWAVSRRVFGTSSWGPTHWIWPFSTKIEAPVLGMSDSPFHNNAMFLSRTLFGRVPSEGIALGSDMSVADMLLACWGDEVVVKDGEDGLCSRSGSWHDGFELWQGWTSHTVVREREMIGKEKMLRR